LEGAQNAEGIFHECGAGVTENPISDIRPSTVRVDQHTRKRIVGDGVDCEVSARGRFGVAESGVRFYDKTAVAGA